MFFRTGLILEDSLTAVVESARHLSPPFPAALDFPAWSIAPDGCVPSSPDKARAGAGIPQHADEFIAKCKEAVVEVEDTIDDNSVDETLTNGDGKRRLVMGKDKLIWLIEADGTRKQIDYPEAGKLNSNAVLRLTQGIQLCGADISTFELDD